MTIDTAIYDEAMWKRIRDTYFSLGSDSIYMNNSTLGPTLKTVQHRMSEIQSKFSRGYDVGSFENDMRNSLPAIREKLRQLINAYDDGKKKGRYIGNVDSATEGLSLVANSISFNRDDVILMTDHEHSGARTMWELQAARYGASVVKIPLLINGEPENEWKENLIARFKEACKKYRVRVITFSWVTTSTGHILPAKELCRLAFANKALSVVDAAQAFCVFPIDVSDLDCDFFVANGHKYLCGPIGSGFICINPRQIGVAWPTIVDDSVMPPDSSFRDLPHRKLCGIAPFTNILPLHEALSFYEEHGHAIYSRLLQIGQWLRKGLQLYPDVFKIATPSQDGLSCIMTSFRIAAKNSEQVFAQLREYRIHIKYSSEGEEQPVVRISPHCFNTRDELDKFSVALCAIAGVDGKDWPALPG